MIKILHTADVHLDSPLKSLALRDPELQERVQTATRSAFMRIVDTAVSEEVEALLISGDLFDGAERSAKTAAFLIEQLDRLQNSGIIVFYIKGNHDAENPMTGEIRLPENVRIFDSRGGKFQVGNLDVWVHGVSFNAKQAPESLLPKFGTPAEGDHHHHHHQYDYVCDGRAKEQNFGQHQHDVTRHGQNIRSFTLVFDQPIKIDTFATALEALLFTQASRLHRIKGIVNTVDRPRKPMVIHGVQHIFHDPVWLDNWPDEDHRTKLVFITDGIERATLDEFFKSWISSSAGHWL